LRSVAVYYPVCVGVAGQGFVIPRHHTRGLLTGAVDVDVGIAHELPEAAGDAFDELTTL